MVFQREKSGYVILTPKCRLKFISILILQTSRDAEFVVKEITTSTVSLGFWSGYARCHLISTRFLGSYAVPLAGEAEEGEDKTGLRLMMPRRWVNLRGETVTATWKAALRAVVGLLLIRPLVDHVSHSYCPRPSTPHPGVASPLIGSIEPPDPIFRQNLRPA
jgi:hypothetical protein